MQKLKQAEYRYRLISMMGELQRYMQPTEGDQVL